MIDREPMQLLMYIYNLMRFFMIFGYFSLYLYLNNFMVEEYWSQSIIRYFWCHFHHILEFTRQLKQQESKKTEENAKIQNVSRFIKNVSRFHKTECIVSTLRKMCHDG